MSIRTSSLYKRNGKVIVCANARGAGGAPLDAEPFVLLEEPVNASDMGRAVTEALAQYRQDAGDDASADEFLGFFAELAGVASYRAFMEGAEYCAIEQSGNLITFHPMVNDEGVFDRLDDTLEKVGLNESPEAIGRVAIRALGRAR